MPRKRLDGEDRKEGEQGWVDSNTVTGRNGTVGSALCHWGDELDENVIRVNN